jgi:glyoxylase-like metal-dependent hydrolase (beta-lactamase superfamily II)
MSTAGFGTSRGMLWPSPLRAGGLDDGAPVPSAPDWTVIAAPGHADDSVALWHEASRTLISGDAVITMRGTPRFAPDTVDDVAATRTAARLRSLPVEHLLPGHGQPVQAAGVLNAAR